MSSKSTNMRKRYDFEVNSPEDEIFTLDNRTSNNRNSIYSVPVYIGGLFLAFLIGLFGLVVLLDSILPVPIMIKDEKSHPNAFINERAVDILGKLTDLGPRVVGSYSNEVLAVDLLQREINQIIENRNPNQKIELDHQIVSGAYYLDYKPSGQINTYTNVQNLIVKISGRHDANHSLLVNAHFDSVPTSPGCMDDGINVAAMLEVLRKMSRKPDQPMHNVVFLFNGAEESVLQASHGFISQHKWAAQCRVVLNLEAAGHGGKIILFQSGPQKPWLMDYYVRVPHPYGQAAGEEIFQSGLIPSDTDFRVFRDAGDLVGLDMAFFKNGYRYHTKYDDFGHLTFGSIQHVGDNTLSLVEGLANAPELGLADANPAGSVVYFDVFGVFMVSYSTLVAAILNSGAVVLSIGLFAYSVYSFKLGNSMETLKFLTKTGGAIIFGWAGAAIFVYATAFVLDIFGYSMSWYGNPWMLFGLYVVPTVVIPSALLFFLNHENLSLNIRCQIQAHCIRLIWTVVLLLGTAMQVRTMYALLLPVGFNCLAFLITYLLRLQHSRRLWQLIYIACLIFPTMMLMYQAYITLTLFIPITGRFGSNKNPDALIGMMTFFFTILVVSPFMALATLIRQSKYLMYGLVAIFGCTFLLVFTPIGFPYSSNPGSPAPQRHWILHTSRVFHNAQNEVEKTDSGLFLLNFDRNSPDSLRPYIKDLKKAKSVDEYCDKYLLCGLPLPHVKAIEIMKFSTWIPAVQPVISKPLKFEVVSKEELSPRIIRYNVSVSGPDRLSIYIVPRPKINLVNISLLETLPTDVYRMGGRPVYYIANSVGIEAQALNFTFDIQVPANFNSSALDLAVTATYVHERQQAFTPYYINVLKQFPAWAEVTPMLGIYNSFIL